MHARSRPLRPRPSSLSTLVLRSQWLGLALAGILSGSCARPTQTKIEPVVIRVHCLQGGVLDAPPPIPPTSDLARELDSEDPPTRRRALAELDRYLAQLEPWAWAAESSCREAAK